MAAIDGIGGFRPQNFGLGNQFSGGAAPAAGLAGNQAVNGFGNGDGTQISPEAQAAAGAQGLGGFPGGGQQIEQQLIQGIQAVTLTGDKTQLQQAYQQGQQSNFQGVRPQVKQAAEQLLGVGQQQDAQQGQQGGGAPQSGGAPESGGTPEAGQSEQAGNDQSKFPEEILKKLDELLGKNKAKEGDEANDDPTKIGDKDKNAGEAGAADAAASSKTETTAAHNDTPAVAAAGTNNTTATVDKGSTASPVKVADSGGSGSSKSSKA